MRNTSVRPASSSGSASLIPFRRRRLFASDATEATRTGSGEFSSGSAERDVNAISGNDEGTRRDVACWTASTFLHPRKPGTRAEGRAAAALSFQRSPFRAAAHERRS